MSNSTNLALPFLTLGQAQKHVTVNESLLRLDALVQLSVVSASTIAQPASPTDASVYILPDGKTGAAWASMTTGALAYYRDGAWEQLSPHEGWLAYARDADKLYVYTGSAWTLFPPGAILTVSATDKVLGRVSSGAGAAEEITFTDQAQQLCDDASFAAMRATLAAAGIADANTFTATQTIDITGSTGLTVRRTDDGAGSILFALDRSSASPTANDGLGVVRITGRNSAGATFNYADLRSFLLDATAGSEDASWEVFTSVAGTLASRATFQAGLVMAGATGGDKGAGTINATAIYDDNVLLTCGPIEFMREGRLDMAKWDAIAAESGKANPRRHEAMHHFARMLDDGFDPRDADNYCARLTADGAAPGLFTQTEWSAIAETGGKPDLGSAATRTFLALDNLAVAFAGLVNRVARLEQALAPKV